MTASNGSGRVVAALIEDLFFLSKISSPLMSAGLDLVVVKPGQAPPHMPIGLFVDLTYSGDWESVVRALAGSETEIIGFGPHTDGALMRRARAAGCDRVMARSKFVGDLAKIVSAWADRASTPA